MNAIKRFYQKIRFILVNYYYLIFKSPAENYLKIARQKKEGVFQKELSAKQDYKKRLSLFRPESQSYKAKSSFAFSSYIHLKRYQKKVRLFTFSSTSAIALSITIFLGFQLFGIIQTKGATFGWNQTDWSGGADTVSTANHISNQENWNKFFSKDANIDTSTPGEVKIAGTSDSFVTTSDADFNAGTQNKTFVSGGAIVARKPFGGTCSANNNCISYSDTNITDVAWCNASVCTNPWISGPCSGIAVYRVDSGLLQWKTSNTACDTPQCGQNGAQNGDNLVASNSVDFSLYPARNACKNIGGRIPTISELQCIYANKAIYDDFGAFQSSTYWSSAEYSSSSYPASNAWNVSLSNGSTNTSNKASTGNNVRCVIGQ